VLDHLAADLGSACADVVLTDPVGDVLASVRSGSCPTEGATAPLPVVVRRVPIADPSSGETAGVLELSCVTVEAGGLALALARRVGREIERRLVDLDAAANRDAFDHVLMARRRARGPVAFLTRQGMLTNAAGGRLVAPEDEPILRRCAMRLLSGSGDGVTTEVLTNGTAVRVRCEPIKDGSTTIGTVLRLSVADGANVGRRRRRNGDDPTFGWASLTDTERAVVDVVAQGLTNLEAGTRLFMSRHTVDAHLRSIYRKLGVSSRVVLTRLALEGAS
jgi:DNA-binding CsgD family transcriptional regulator